MALHASEDATVQTPSARERFQAEHRRIWNEAVDARGPGLYYHRRLAQIYRFLVSPNKRVLEIGCATGDLLAAVAPSRGVGVDFADKRLEVARRRHPTLHFVESAIEDSTIDDKFDFIILSDVVN